MMLFIPLDIRIFPLLYAVYSLFSAYDLVWVRPIRALFKKNFDFEDAVTSMLAGYMVGVIQIVIGLLIIKAIYQL